MSDSEGEAGFDLFGDNQPNENDQKTNVVSTLEVLLGSSLGYHSLQALDPEALLSAVSEKLERVQKCQAKEEELAQAQQEISFNDTARLDATLQELEQVMVESEALTNELAATAVVVQGRIQMLQAKIASSKADRIKNLTLLRRLLQVSEQLQRFVRCEEKEDGDFNGNVCFLKKLVPVGESIQEALSRCRERGEGRKRKTQGRKQIKSRKKKIAQRLRIFIMALTLLEFESLSCAARSLAISRSRHTPGTTSRACGTERLRRLFDSKFDSLTNSSGNVQRLSHSGMVTSPDPKIPFFSSTATASQPPRFWQRSYTWRCGGQ